MKPFLNSILMVAATLASAAAVAFGEPARADLLLASAATQVVSASGLLLPEPTRGAEAAGR
ncbi:MAG: hypothetical protein KF796_17855 [Ramlibacter sp.]|nr:hypothetical protein [Ramlibacter sp.]